MILDGICLQHVYFKINDVLSANVIMHSDHDLDVLKNCHMGCGGLWGFCAPKSETMDFREVRLKCGKWRPCRTCGHGNYVLGQLWGMMKHESNFKWLKWYFLN